MLANVGAIEVVEMLIFGAVLGHKGVRRKNGGRRRPRGVYPSPGTAVWIVEGTMEDIQLASQKSTAQPSVYLPLL